MRLLILISVLASGMLAFQVPEGAAESCDNNHSNAHKCECLRAMSECKMPGDKAEPDMKCKTYCRRERCFCAGPSCTSRKGN